MISQLVFGECGDILEEAGAWVRVRNREDGYEGWVDSKMILPGTPETLKSLPEPSFALSGSLQLQDGTEMRLPVGARIPINIGTSSFFWEDHEWKSTPSLQLLSQQPKEHLLEVAQLFINTPYLWGGRSGAGIDCSGFTQLVFRMCGQLLPRDSTQQAEGGEQIEFGKHQVGDLAFFTKPGKDRISHVGMVGKGNVIYHASGKVRLDFLTKNGILKHPTGNATHILVYLKRY